MRTVISSEKKLFLIFPEEFSDINNLPRCWNFTTGRESGRTLFAEQESAVEVYCFESISDSTMLAAKHTDSDDSTTKRDKTAQCLSQAAVSYDNRSAKIGKIDTLNN